MEKFRMMIIAELQRLLGEDYELEAVETKKIIIRFFPVFVLRSRETK